MIIDPAVPGQLDDSTPGVRFPASASSVYGQAVGKLIGQCRRPAGLGRQREDHLHADRGSVSGAAADNRVAPAVQDGIAPPRSTIVRTIQPDLAVGRAAETLSEPLQGRAERRMRRDLERRVGARCVERIPPGRQGIRRRCALVGGGGGRNHWPRSRRGHAVREVAFDFKTTPSRTSRKLTAMAANPTVGRQAPHGFGGPPGLARSVRDRATSTASAASHEGGCARIAARTRAMIFLRPTAACVVMLDSCSYLVLGPAVLLQVRQCATDRQRHRHHSLSERALGSACWPVRWTVGTVVAARCRRGVRKLLIAEPCRPGSLADRDRPSALSSRLVNGALSDSPQYNRDDHRRTLDRARGIATAPGSACAGTVIRLSWLGSGRSGEYPCRYWWSGGLLLGWCA